MAEMFDRQIDRWQMLADRVDAELTEVQKALVQGLRGKRKWLTRRQNCAR